MENFCFVENILKICELREEKPTRACINAGVGKDFMTNLKKGQFPSIEKVYMLARYFNITVSELLGEPLPADGLTPEERALLTAYRRADQRARDMVEVALAPFSAKEKTTTAG